ncbi:MAG: alpha/beta fold hydrolase [Proteobacteria bacterium]|nr:alpha/beta fold hydrolase [Pseudomonadota bacterium]
MSRDTVVFLPGLLCDRAVWEPQIAALSARFDCLVADYGAADSLAVMAQAALASAPPRFSLAGHSMGGRVALELMRTAPQRVDAIALLDTGYQARAPGEAGEAEARARYRLLDIAFAQGMRVMGREWVRGMVHSERLPDRVLMEAILAMIERKTPGIFAAQIRALLDRPSAEDVLRAIRCPTLVLCGRQDNWSPLRRHEEMAGMVAGARLAVIEESGHMVTLERPQAVTAALQGWLADLRVPP